ncbi:MAG TPA: cell division protein FtsZ [Hyphomicrobiaceae bacterium]|nr:cell division protein FtsZ [Hyphomicrobiaceae bacterium]
MSINLQLPKLTDLRPRITVIGVGGAGGNAVNNMIASGLGGVEFIVANTDAQALATSSAERRIQLGVNLTEGLGAGSKPEIGQAAAEEAIEDIRSHIIGSHMVFIAAGMGGGTGTGAAAVIARTARELGILTVGVVTKPFQFEGARRMRAAEAGILELKKHVDTLIVIPNQNLFRVANEKTTFAEAFVLADQVLYSGIACIVDLIVKEGLINLDFADVRTVMSGMGSAMMGTGEATGERRAIRAAEEAIANPLLDEVSLKGAKGLLLSIIGGQDMTLYEVDEAASRVRQEVDPEANIIVGASFDDSMGERIRVAIVASGMQQPATAVPPQEPGMSRAFAHLQQVARNLGGGALQHASDAAGQRQPPPSRPHLSSPAMPAQNTGPGTPPPIPPSRELWRAPGGIVIEEPFQPPHAGRPGAVHEHPRAPENFTPGPPEDVHRGGRRMPEVGDFPAVAQREYRAKSGMYEEDGQSFAHRYDDSAPQPGADRGGLFQRLIGSATNRGAGRRGEETRNAGSDRDGRHSGDGRDLPFFFRRNKG